MRVIFIAIIALISASSFLIVENDMTATGSERKALSAKKVIFLGANFEKLRLLDSEGFVGKNGKTKCGALKFKYYNSWNEVFMLEDAKYNPDELLIVKSHVLSIERSAELNDSIQIDTCLIDDLDYKISKADVQDIVNQYVGHVDAGIGVLVIGESLSKKLGRGAHIIAYFDTESGKLLLHKRYEAGPVGSGFDNYWVNTIHKALEQHQGYVKKTRKKLKIKI